MGAVTLSRTGDSNTGDFGEATILTTYGEADRGMPGSEIPRLQTSHSPFSEGDGFVISAL